MRKCLVTETETLLHLSGVKKISSVYFGGGKIRKIYNKLNIHFRMYILLHGNVVINNSSKYCELAEL